MASTSHQSNPDPLPAARFVTTHWTDVLAAGRSDTTRARDALARLCETYWYPLYVYVRQRGYEAPDAQDLTQEFFARLLAGNWLAQADRQRGHFRTFLLSAMKHFLANEWHKARTLKRGGGVPLTSLSVETAEYRYAHEPATTLTPERLFERRWALALLDDVLTDLEREYQQEGKATLFDSLKNTLTAAPNQAPYSDLAARLGLTDSALRVAVHRLRHRYRQLLKSKIAETVSTSSEVEEEMHYLFEVLTRH